MHGRTCMRRDLRVDQSLGYTLQATKHGCKEIALRATDCGFENVGLKSEPEACSPKPEAAVETAYCDATSACPHLLGESYACPYTLFSPPARAQNGKSRTGTGTRTFKREYEDSP